MDYNREILRNSKADLPPEGFQLFRDECSLQSSFTDVGCSPSIGKQIPGNLEQAEIIGRMEPVSMLGSRSFSTPASSARSITLSLSGSNSGR
jgi:hypothetical protein